MEGKGVCGGAPIRVWGSDKEEWGRDGWGTKSTSVPTVNGTPDVPGMIACGSLRLSTIRSRLELSYGAKRISMAETLRLPALGFGGKGTTLTLIRDARTSLISAPYFGQKIHLSPIRSAILEEVSGPREEVSVPMRSSGRMADESY